jgi:hypothetical protein
MSLQRVESYITNWNGSVNWGGLILFSIIVFIGIYVMWYEKNK